jgi:hypothetical protein
MGAAMSKGSATTLMPRLNLAVANVPLGIRNSNYMINFFLIDTPMVIA